MLSNLRLYLLSVLGFLTLLLSVFISGRKSARKDAEIEQNKEYIETRERMDEVERPADANAARDWLRKRGE
jgi:hypothetical protein